MKKKFLFVFLMLALLPIFASCTYINTLLNLSKRQTYPKMPITVNYYVDDELYKSEKTEKRDNFKYPDNPSKDGLNFGGWTYYESYQTLEPNDFLFDETESIDLYAYFSKGTHFSDNLSYNGPEISKGCLPSLGSPKVLVVPVNLGGEKTNAMLSDINEAFNGTAESTGYESVKSFYEKSSMGRLNLTFDIFDGWFTPSKNASYYENYDPTKDSYYESGAGLILHEFLEKYDSMYDFSDYDYNNDGYIDSVWMVYNVKPSYSSSNTFYWAYVTTTLNSTKKYDNKLAKYYGFASYYFIKEKDLEVEQGRKLELYDMSDIDIDAHTYIHETGHLLGLDDYYDTDTSRGKNSGGLYTAGMMDCNRGDLNSIDKVLLGWADPYVVYSNSEKTVTIDAFSSTNDVIMLAKTKPTSIYGEYYLIELYNSEGLVASDHAIEVPTASARIKAQNKSYKNYGLRILHVNASLTYEYQGKKYSYPVEFAYNNSTTNTLFVDTVLNNNYSTEYYSNVKKTVLNLYGLYNEVKDYNITYNVTKTTTFNLKFRINQISTTSANITFDI